ncbi:MAG: potassium channel family protein [Clostridia bacterium]
MRPLKQLYLAVAGMVLAIVIGATGFSILDEKSFFDSLWMTMVTVLTIGYGDMVPESQAAKTFGLIMIPLSVGLVSYALASIAAVMIEGMFSEKVRIRRMEKTISQLHGHVVLCGLGRVGRQVVWQLQQENVPFVVVDRSITQIEKLGEGTLFVEGNATDDPILIKAGIERAIGVIATLPEDADNVFVALTAKGLNPAIRVVARAEKKESEEKMLRAGIDKIISPSSIGGRRMAMSILKPVSVDFVDILLHTHQEDYSVEEILVKEGSMLADRGMADSRIREKYGVTVVAIKRGSRIISNPAAHEHIHANDLLIVFGSHRQLSVFEKVSKEKSIS